MERQQSFGIRQGFQEIGSPYGNPYRDWRYYSGYGSYPYYAYGYGHSSGLGTYERFGEHPQAIHYRSDEEFRSRYPFEPQTRPHTWRGGILGWLGSGMRAATGWVGGQMQTWGQRIGGALSGRSAELAEAVRGGGQRMGRSLEETGEQASAIARGYEPGLGPASSRGRPPRRYRRPDERVLDDVCERIARSGADADDVEVQVNEGILTLSGKVPSRVDRRIVEDVAEGVFGVEEVHNNLRVARQVEQRSEPGESTEIRGERSGNGHGADIGGSPVQGDA